MPAAAKANHDLALAETLRLVRLGSVPPTAHQLPGPTANAPQPGMGVAGTTSRIASTTYYLVPMSEARSDAWIKAHPPHNLSHSGSSSASVIGRNTSVPGDTLGEEYGAPNSPAWTEASLDFTVAAFTSGTSLWRIDGIAIWVNPVPIEDTGTGNRIHVTIADGCPSSDKNIDGVMNPSASLGSKLVPDKTPTSVLICRYQGMNDRPYALTSHQSFTGPRAAGLGVQAQKINLSFDSGEGTHSCPMDDESKALVVFGYADGSSVDLWQKTTGCLTISNGSVIALGAITVP